MFCGRKHQRRCCCRTRRASSSRAALTWFLAAGQGFPVLGTKQPRPSLLAAAPQDLPSPRCRPTAQVAALPLLPDQRRLVGPLDQPDRPRQDARRHRRGKGGDGRDSIGLRHRPHGGGSRGTGVPQQRRRRRPPRCRPPPGRGIRCEHLPEDRDCRGPSWRRQQQASVRALEGGDHRGRIQTVERARPLARRRRRRRQRPCFDGGRSSATGPERIAAAAVPALAYCRS